MKRKPRIAVILDENTSGDASRYEASKGLFSAIRDAGGLPFGIPYLPEIVGPVVEEFDGLVCGGGGSLTLMIGTWAARYLKRRLPTGLRSSAKLSRHT